MKFLDLPIAVESNLSGFAVLKLMMNEPRFAILDIFALNPKLAPVTGGGLVGLLTKSGLAKFLAYSSTPSGHRYLNISNLQSKELGLDLVSCLKLWVYSQKEQRYWRVEKIGGTFYALLRAVCD
ncbi:MULTISPECIES: hypothetical protein [unclassified Pseudovibrio]|uniref:hypothetical protein n=1 Tax=unclassified Pseudovibrio TaxID=2627060 RepID=UPI0007AEC59F|nr:MULTISPECIES: hypothetical protein [unclassified Pseudovibrio]KZL02946.1 hypothetical protein PsW74_01145 [Pseudovibrio sp. W74]KZL07649.1 hypothetical protein PsAD14_04039 [Pseudovibrio sp. Ad14]